MSETRQDLHFVVELIHPPEVVMVEPLDGHLVSTGEDPQEHDAEPTISYHVILGERARGFHELFVRELFHVRGDGAKLGGKSEGSSGPQLVVVEARLTRSVVTT